MRLSTFHFSTTTTTTSTSSILSISVLLVLHLIIVLVISAATTCHAFQASSSNHRLVFLRISVTTIPPLNAPSYRVTLRPTAHSHSHIITRNMNLFSLFSSSSSSSKNTRNEFQNRNVLITGASSGLGRSMALLLATQCQCNIIILSARSVGTLQAVQKECYDAIEASAATSSSSSSSSSKSTPQRPRVTIHIVTADLSQSESVQELARQTMEICQKDESSSKTLDVLINNGGVSSRSTFVETDIAIDQQMMQINFFAGAILAKAMIQHHGLVYNIQKSSSNSNSNSNSSTGSIDDTTTSTQKGTNRKSPHGRIIWISSVQGKIGIPNRSSYAASKFAVQGYCECIRAELYNEPYNIHVHTVSPGYIRTNLSKSALTGTPGTVYGKMDPTTEQGMDPNTVAIQIMNAVAQNQLDIIVAAGLTTYLAIYMKLLVPQFLQSIMVRRYQKSIASRSIMTNDKDKNE